MKLTLKLCLVAALWVFGMYQGSLASSDPAGQAWAELLPKVFALILSIPVTISIARTRLPETVRYRKRIRALLCVPLAIAASPLVVVVVVYGALFLFPIVFHPVTLTLLLVGTLSRSPKTGQGVKI